MKDEKQGTIKELEVDEIFIKCGRILDDGKIPVVASMRDGAFSRKALVSYVLGQMAGAFENKQTLNEKKSKQFRIWVGEEGPLDEGQVNFTLEEAGIRSEEKVFVEFMLESREWPS